MDLRQIEALLVLLGSHSVSEFEFEDSEVCLRFKWGRVGDRGTEAASVLSESHGVRSDSQVAASMVVPLSDPRLVEVDSPMVGTFYRSTTPGAPAFIDVGSVIQSGQVVCIVEAMKLMNEIESEVAGTVVEVLAENGQPVQFGQPLFRVRRS